MSRARLLLVDDSDATKRAKVLNSLKDASSRIELFTLEGKPLGELPLPGLGTASMSVSQDRTEAFLTYASRARRRNSEEVRSDRMDEQATEFHRRVRDAYLSLASRHPERFRVIPADRPVETVAAAIWKAVAGYV